MSITEETDVSAVDHPNLGVVIKVGELISRGFTGGGEALVAEDFVFHYFNKRLPDLAGDTTALTGCASSSGGSWR